MVTGTICGRPARVKRRLPEGGFSVAERKKDWYKKAKNGAVPLSRAEGQDRPGDGRREGTPMSEKVIIYGKAG